MGTDRFFWKPQRLDRALMTTYRMNLLSVRSISPDSNLKKETLFDFKSSAFLVGHAAVTFMNLGLPSLELIPLIGH